MTTIGFGVIKYPCSSMILAGDSPAPQSLLSFLADRCEETMLVTDDPLRHLMFDGLILAASRNRHHPFAAVYAGLFAAVHAHVLVVEGQRTEVGLDLLQKLLEAAEPRWDLVIANTRSGLEPTLAVYSKRCLKHLAQHISQERFNTEGFYAKLNKRVIPKA